jgi:glycosyltransferase involved in cell wall biosynthesis
LVTYNAPDRLKQTAFTIPNVDKFVIVNDGTGSIYPPDVYPKSAEVICHDKNLSVGCAKNTALRALIQAGCDHLFIIEDDILIKNPAVFEKYIQAAYKSGLYHFCYALHGPANLKPDGTKNPRQVVDYGDGNEIAFYGNCVGGFCYYLKGVIRNVGYMDERFKNAWEHVEHSYRIVKAGLLPLYWNWPDLAKSDEYLAEIGSSEVQSVIRKTETWTRNMQAGAHLFKHLHGYFPTEVPDGTPEELLEKLKAIQKNYSKQME